MSMPVRVSDELYNAAKKIGKNACRSAAQQVEFWAKVGKAGYDNPDLPVSFIANILEAQEQESEPFEFED